MDTIESQHKMEYSLISSTGDDDVAKMTEL